jgi:hypothetical protein
MSERQMSAIPGDVAVMPRQCARIALGCKLFHCAPLTVPNFVPHLFQYASTCLAMGGNDGTLRINSKHAPENDA